MDSKHVTSSLGAHYGYHSRHAGKFKTWHTKWNMVTFLIGWAIMGEWNQWQTTRANTSHTWKPVQFTYTTKWSQFNMHNVSPVICELHMKCKPYKCWLFYIMEYSVDLFKPKYGLNVRHIIFNITISCKSQHAHNWCQTEQSKTETEQWTGHRWAGSITHH
jgi:hypothetical protein